MADSYTFKMKGFTLLEILIVVVLIGILSSLAVATFSNTAEKGRAAEAKTQLLMIQAAEDIYYSQNGKYTKKVSNLNLVGPSSTAYSYRILSANIDNDFTAQAIRNGAVKYEIYKSGPVQAK